MNWRFIDRLFVLVVCIITICPVNSAAPLQGKVEHAKSVPALPPSMCPGATLTEDAFDTTNAGANAKWFRMPDWLAGTWSRPAEAEVIYEENLVTGVKNPCGRQLGSQFVGNEVCGYQKDPTGKIWHCLLIPYKRAFVDDASQSRTISIVESARDLETSTAQVIIKRLSTRFEMNGADEIKKVVRCEEYTKYTPDGHGGVQTESSVKYFDEKGKPLLLQKTCSHLTRVSGFKKCDYWPHDEEVDLRPLFREFLNVRSLGTSKILMYDTKKQQAAGKGAKK